jgi:Co/Zn/Cd efflux system component
MRIPPHIVRRFGLAAAFIVAVVLWVICLLLLMEVTRQLLDTMRFIIEIAQMD